MRAVGTSSATTQLSAAMQQLPHSFYHTAYSSGADALWAAAGGYCGWILRVLCTASVMRVRCGSVGAMFAVGVLRERLVIHLLCVPMQCKDSRQTSVGST